MVVQISLLLPSIEKFTFLNATLNLLQSKVINHEVLTLSRGKCRIFGRGSGLIQGTNLLGGDVLQHAKYAGTRGPGGMPPQENFLK